MSNPNMLDQHVSSESEPQSPADSGESFEKILSEFEQSHSHRPEEGGQGLHGTVVAVTSEGVFLDIGRKTEGRIALEELRDHSSSLSVKPGDQLQVSVRGRDSEGYYLLSKIKVERPKDWSSLERAFNEKLTIGGMVTAVVKGGLSVDVGVRAFMPASRSGARDTAEMESLVGQEITCKIIKLDVADEDVVVDRRMVLEEETARAKEQRFLALKEGDTVQGTVRSLTDYGAFVDVGSVDGLLHVADISWGRVNKPADVLTPGQPVEVQVLKIDLQKRRVSLGMKQLQPHPWELAGEKYSVGQRVSGVITRVTDFGAFVELEPGVEGLIHLSEMSWSKKVRKPGDVVKPGHVVDVVVLGISSTERRISLGLKQALGDPWVNIEKKYVVGSTVEGPVTNIQKFGAFVQLEEGIEGMIHVGDITADKRINHPQEILKPGQSVRAAVLEVDREKRRIRLGMKQLVPTSLDEYIAEHKEGDLVTGRVADISRGSARVDLGEGIQATCSLGAPSGESQGPADNARPDLTSLSSMLAAKWKQGTASGGGKEPIRAGQIRSFRIARLEAANKRIELELAG